MVIIEIFIIGIALSLDAFAVSIVKGVQLPNRSNFAACIVALYFALFQMLMPIIGYFLGASVNTFVDEYSGIISFVILGYLGLNMLKNALKNEDDAKEEVALNPLAFMSMLMAAIATSIDALAVGLVFRFHYTLSLFISVIIIGCTTFSISFIGVRLGYLFSDRFRQKAEILGALVLILLGLRFLFS